VPAARDFLLAYFASPALGSQKAAVVQQLGEVIEERTYPDEVNTPNPAIGNPGTPAQARARLELLDQISPLCPEPLIQQKIAAARASLRVQVASGAR
jgi:hypothetical protein